MEVAAGRCSPQCMWRCRMDASLRAASSAPTGGTSDLASMSWTGTSTALGGYCVDRVQAERISAVSSEELDALHRS